MCYYDILSYRFNIIAASWWHHGMEMLTPLCNGNPLVPSQKASKTELWWYLCYWFEQTDQAGDLRRRDAHIAMLKFVNLLPLLQTNDDHIMWWYAVQRWYHFDFQTRVCSVCRYNSFYHCCQDWISYQDFFKLVRYLMNAINLRLRTFPYVD